MDHMVVAVVNTKLFINKKLDKESWHCSINPGSCHPTIHHTESIFLVPRLNISQSKLFLWNPGRLGPGSFRTIFGVGHFGLGRWLVSAHFQGESFRPWVVLAKVYIETNQV